MTLDDTGHVRELFSQALKAAINEKTGGNVQRFCAEARLSRGSVIQWRDKKALPKKTNLQKLIDYTGKTEEFFLPGKKTYQCPPEHMGAPKTNGRDSRPQLYTEPKDIKFVPKTLFEAPHPDQEHIDAVIDILDSGEQKTINALKSNIKEFHEKIVEKKKAKQEKGQFEFRQRKSDRELAKVKREMESLRKDFISLEAQLNPEEMNN